MRAGRLPFGRHGPFVFEGFTVQGNTYQRLRRGSFVIMMNTPEVLAGYSDFLENVEGDVLINGLGMGMCTEYALERANVGSVTVVENDSELIGVMAPHFPDVEIIHADAFEREIGRDERYGFVLHDIFYNRTEIEQGIGRLFKKHSCCTERQSFWRHIKNPEK